MDKDKTAQRVAEKIANLLKKMDYTQARLAEEAGITPAAVSQILKAERLVSTPVLRRIASVLKVSTDYLLGDKEESELSDLLQDDNVQSFFRDFKNLSIEDQNQMKALAEFLKSKKK